MRDDDSYDPDDEEPADFDRDEDLEEPDLIACPHCRKMILADAEQCPRCGQYVTHEQMPHASGRPVWVVVIIVALIVAAVLLW